MTTPPTDVDPDSDQARLARHRALHNLGLKPPPSALADTLAEALQHLDRVLNGCQTHAEQQEADAKARSFLDLHR